MDTSPSGEWLDNNAYRTHLIEKVQPAYQKIKNHIIQTDTSGDIRFIDKVIRDYSNRNDPYIHYEGDVTLMEGDHSIYSYNSVKKLFKDHQDVFPHNYSEESIRSFISKNMQQETYETEEAGAKPYGLLCGYPIHAVNLYCDPTQGLFGANSVTMDLLGREYCTRSGDERDNTAHMKDQFLLYYSGMGDFIEDTLTNTD